MLDLSAGSLGQDFAFPDDFLQGFLPSHDLQGLEDYPNLDLDGYFLHELSSVEVNPNRQDFGMIGSLFDRCLIALTTMQTRQTRIPVEHCRQQIQSVLSLLLVAQALRMVLNRQLSCPMLILIQRPSIDGNQAKLPVSVCVL